MKKIIATVAIMLGLAACGGGGSDGGGVYKSTGAVISDLNKAGVSCNGDGKVTETIVSPANEDCLIPGGDETEFYSVNVFASTDQKEEARDYLPRVNPDKYFVFGENWSVGLDTEAQANKVADNMGGEIIGPEFEVQ